MELSCLLIQSGAILEYDCEFGFYQKFIRSIMQKLYVEYWVNSLKVYHNYFNYQFTLPVLRLHFTSRKIDIGIKLVTLSQNRIYNRRKFPLLPTYLELCFLIWEVNRKIIFQLFTTDRDLTLFSDFAWFLLANITYREGLHYEVLYLMQEINR